MKSKRKKFNKKLLPYIFLITGLICTLLIAGWFKQQNKIAPIMTKTAEELYGDYIDEDEATTSAHSNDNGVLPPLPNSKEEKVLLNTQSMKFHKVNCEWAQECQNCIILTKKEAIRRGGKPCKVCL